MLNMNKVVERKCKTIVLIICLALGATPQCIRGQAVLIDSLMQQLDGLVEADSGYISTLHRVADHYAYKGDDVARLYIATLEEYGKKYTSTEAINYYYSDMATLMKRQNKIDSAQYFWKLEIQNSKNDSFQIARIYHEMSGAHLSALSYDSIEYYTTLAIDITKRHNPENLKFLAQCYNMMGIANDIKEDQIKAIEYYIKSVEIKEKIGDRISAANTYANLATVYGRGENHQQSLYYDKKALDIARELEIDDLESFALHSIGTTQKTLKDYDSAEENLLAALEIRTRTKDSWELCMTLYVLGNLYREKSEYDKSIAYYDRAIIACKEAENEYTLGNVLINMARLLITQKKYGQAKIVTDQAIQIADKLKIISSQQHAYQVKADVESKLGNHQVAFAYLESYHAIHDSLQLRRLNKDVQDLQLKYESKEKQAVIKEQELQIIKGSNERNVLLIGLLSLAFLAFLLFWRYRQHKRMQQEKIKSLKREQKLLAIDSMLNGQQEERKRIAQELHDGLGGLLTSAKLQIHRVQDEIDKLEGMNLVTSTEALIDDACTEVRRIAHDMMPSALVNLGLADAVDDLADTIRRAGNINVETYFSHRDMAFTDKQSLMLYRIIQEASNNTMKYASASTLIIQLISEPKFYFLTIEDDGTGILDKEAKRGSGILNIESRVQYLEGEYEMINSDKGLTYEIRIPK